MGSQSGQLGPSSSPHSWADAGAPKTARPRLRPRSKGDEAQASLRKLHCASVPRTAAAVQTASPSVCRLSSIAGSEARARTRSEPTNPSGKEHLKEIGDPVAWRAPQGGVPAVWGATVGHDLSCGVEPDQESAREKGGRLHRNVANHQLRGWILRGPNPDNAKNGRSMSNK